ncbi:MAG: LytTR family transcriptional regulator DNA-binding domain-containing protein, partial [Bacteroidota bacterium]
PSLYGTVLNAVLFYGTYQHIRNNSNALLGFAILRMFLLVGMTESILDMAFFGLIRQKMSWYVALDIAAGNGLMNLFFFVLPAIFYAAFSHLKDNSKSQKIIVKDGHRLVSLEPSKILFAEASLNYVKFHTTDKLLIERCTLKEVEKRLPGIFIRCHKSFIVNKERITEKSARSLKVESHSIPIGRRYKNASGLY